MDRIHLDLLTMLHYAALFGHTSAVKMLIQIVTNIGLVDKLNQDGNLMLEYSICNDWVDLEKALMLVSFHLVKVSDLWTKIERSWFMPTHLPVYEEERLKFPQCGGVHKRKEVHYKAGIP